MPNARLCRLNHSLADETTSAHFYNLPLKPVKNYVRSEPRSIKKTGCVFFTPPTLFIILFCIYLTRPVLPAVSSGAQQSAQQRCTFGLLFNFVSSTSGLISPFMASINGFGTKTYKWLGRTSNPKVAGSSRAGRASKAFWEKKFPSPEARATSNG